MRAVGLEMMVSSIKQKVATVLFLMHRLFSQQLLLDKESDDAMRSRLGLGKYDV